ncbi:uncharacterized protein LOC111871730 [Cryptotermes secundus]|uniref:uncharacterized protein LOC111871730 n=1 Tax=Cryptotermes secundus TaxID=105785 RepID=UPI001454C755|nr:uncharacterized protein LOC111871730 [Cryptotermes secundus]
MAMYTTGSAGELAGGQLTMGIIGCLPDNVQQAIKSFSIQDGRQHITLAFPTMEELVKRFAEPPGPTALHERPANCGCFMSITPALLFDRCPEVIQGFETLVTLVPTTLRTSHPVGLLTVNQKGTMEGVKRHLESLVSLLATNRTVHTLWHMPLITSDLSGTVLEQVLDNCSKRILEAHGDSLAKLYPLTRPHELLLLVKEKILQPSFLSYKELLLLNIQEVTSRLSASSSTTDPCYFKSLMEHLQSPSCTLPDFRRIHMYLMSPQLDPAIRELWRVWSHEQVASKVFPVCNASNRLGSLFYTTSPQGEMCMINQSAGAAAALLGHVTHVPIKEGLHSVIKCLKNQDLAFSPPSSPEDKPLRSRTCACAVCRGETGHCRSSRRQEKMVSAANLGQESAFHRPATSSPNQRFSLLSPALCSSERYRGHDGPQQGLHTPVPVILKYYTGPSNVVTPPPSMYYRWKMFADN